MSFFDDASLAFLPSGAAGKDGKAYSIKPTDGTGDFTFSRGSNLAATRVGADGLIEKGRENLILQSNNFDTTWLNQLGTGTITSGQSGYDGSTDAWEISKDTSTFRSIRQAITASGVLTYSVYIKSGTLTDAALRVDTSGGAVQVLFDLTDGSSLLAGGTAITKGSENIGGGWYRCFVTLNASVSNVHIYVDRDGTTAGSIYIQDAQLEIGLAATDVISTGATTGKAGLLEDEPRFDYSGGATCPSLLLEPSRRNIASQSEYFGSGFTTSGTTIDTNTTISPEGLTNATKLVETATTGEHRLNTTAIPVTAGQDYTISVFAKKAGSGDRDFIAFDFGSNNTTYANDKVYFNLSTGAVATKAATIVADIKPYANGWYRCIATCEALATDNASFEIKVADADDSDSYAGDISKGVYIWGFQAEDVQAGTGASYPTSYIPNHSGGSVTRGADVATGAGDATTFNDSEGVLYAEISTLSLSDTSERQITISDTSKNSYLRIQYGGTPGMIYLFLYINGVKVADIRKDSLDTTNKHKVAIRYGSAGYSGFVDGVLIETDAYAGNFVSYPLNSLDFFQWKGNAKQILYFPTTLSDAECISLTS